MTTPTANGRKESEEPKLSDPAADPSTEAFTDLLGEAVRVLTAAPQPETSRTLATEQIVTEVAVHDASRAERLRELLDDLARPNVQHRLTVNDSTGQLATQAGA